jgi:cation diffusion facilitator CzcD-associated flavoprotein CzcO
MRTRAPDDDMTGRTVIVGAGQAGARTAAALRRLDRRIACAEIADVGRPLPSQARAQT